jgi:hypothetical protein
MANTTMAMNPRVTSKCCHHTGARSIFEFRAKTYLRKEEGGRRKEEGGRGRRKEKEGYVNLY